VRLDAPDAHVQHVRDLTVAHPGCYEFRNPLLGWRQAFGDDGAPQSDPRQRGFG
jgi:hypothetical protein